MPLLLAVAMAGTATPIYVAHPAIVKAAVSNAFGTKENTIHIAQFGGYDIKTTVTYKDGKVTDLQIKGENFEGKYAKENENIYLPKAINKIKDQIQGLDITDQNSFDKVDTVSGATTSASAIKNAVMESLGLTSKRGSSCTSTRNSGRRYLWDSDEKHDKYSRT